jgi:DNA-directed RNA polymerase specialized sigma24 family protein
MLQCMRAAMAAMPPLRRDVYLLIASEGLSYAAVAEQLQLPIPQVAHLLAQALVDLMQALDDDCAR